MNHKIAIISAHYYKKICDHLASNAAKHLETQGFASELVKVSGALEIPTALKLLHNSNRFDGFVLLGCIVKGETNHYEFISQAIFNSILNLSTTLDIPIGIGILTVNHISQAMERADKQNKGGDAAEACLRLLELKKLNSL